MWCLFRRLLDSIKTSCRSLIRIGNGEVGRVPLSYWLGSCAVPLFIQLYPERHGRQTPLDRQRCLEKLALHMQVSVEHLHLWSICHVCQAEHCVLAFKACAVESCESHHFRSPADQCTTRATLSYVEYPQQSVLLLSTHAILLKTVTIIPIMCVIAGLGAAGNVGMAD